MTAIHPYFTAQARAVFQRAGGDPDALGALASWAQQAHEVGDSRRGVIVAEDGELVAQTRYRPHARATYVAAEDATRCDLLGSNPALPARARQLGGRWDPATETWEFDARDEGRVRELAATCTG